MIVLKLGASALASQSRAVAEVARFRPMRIVVVVSALAETSDRLLARARSFDAQDPHGVAALLSTGESESVALLSLALADAGLAANPLDHGLRTEGPALEAEIARVDGDAILRALDHRPVVVVPGSVGRDAIGRTTWLGRGGADLTAVAIAHEISARCRLIIDAHALVDANGDKFAHAKWDDLLALDETHVSQKAIRWARAHELSFEVGALGRRDGRHS